MQINGTPLAEIHIDTELVHTLLTQQHPDLADLPIRVLESGWDNVIYRVGKHLLVRLPRRAVAAALVINEQRWLPQLAQQLSLPIPTPVRIGKPTPEYPWYWSVVPWISGTTADQAILNAEQGKVLATFLNALHVRAPADVPHNPVRGVPLMWRESAVRERMMRLQNNMLAASREVRAVWDRALAAPLDAEDTWIHGDLHARNVLVQEGRIVAVIDWGDVAQGDRATDLAAIWMLLADRTAREIAMNACVPTSTSTWQRARGWAVLFGITLLDTGLVDNARHAAMGDAILRRIVEGP